jgi:hypothetical protein
MYPGNLIFYFFFPPSERNSVKLQHKKMRRLLLSTYLFGAIILACLFHVCESIGNEDSPEGYLIEYEDGTFEFIPPGQTAGQFTTSEEEAELLMAITNVGSGTTSFLSRATEEDLQRKSASALTRSKCGFKLAEPNASRRGNCRQRRLLRGPKGEK